MVFTWVPRKLEGVHQDLMQMTGEGMVKGFLNNVGNANKLGSLLEDIHDALMEYQVCIKLGCMLL